ARPDDAEAVYLVGRAALGAGQLEQAERLFLHVLSLDPRQCYAMVNLGRTYMALARWSEAEGYLRQASACAPRLAVVYETIGDLYIKTGMPQQAAVAYRRAEEIEPGAATARRLDRPRPAPGRSPVGPPKEPPLGWVRVPPLRRGEVHGREPDHGRSGARGCDRHDRIDADRQLARPEDLRQALDEGRDRHVAVRVRLP